MTPLTLESARMPVLSSSSTVEVARGFRSFTIDEGWRETLSILGDREFLERFQRGLEQLERGELHSFEEVFGEPL